MSYVKCSASLLVLLLTASAFAILPPSAEAWGSSADAYGYKFVTNTGEEPTVAMDWKEISGTGTDVGFVHATSSYVGPVPIGFDFTFYGNTYSELFISCNGFVSFGAGSGAYSNVAIPNTAAPNNIIAAFWDSLDVNNPPYNSGQVYYETMGTPSERQMVVQWDQVSRMSYLSLMTFQIVLNETGEIWLQYLTMGGETGTSATIGIENSDGTLGLQYSYNAGAASDGFAIMFHLTSLGFGPDRSGSTNAGSYAWYVLTLTNHQADPDTFDITYTSDLGLDVTLYDGVLNLLTDTDGSGDVDTGPVASGGTFTVRVYISVPWYPPSLTDVTTLTASSAADPSLYDTARLTTTILQARFTEFHSDYAKDVDADGLYDYLVVNVSIQAAIDGNVYLYMYLYDSDDLYLQYIGKVTTLPAGSSNVTFEFDGELIRAFAADGQFRVRMHLYNAYWQSTDVKDYLTAPYLASEFAPPAAVFSPPHSDWAVDEDIDGLYDYLHVGVSIEVFEEGEYTVYGELTDWAYYDLGDDVFAGWLAPGVYELDFVFPGYQVKSTGRDSPYYLELYLFDGSETLIDTDRHTVEGYMNSEFTDPPAVFAPPHYDFAQDTDGSGLYDEIVIVVYIECHKTGYYDLEANVNDYYGGDVLYVYETLYMEEGEAYEHGLVLTADMIVPTGGAGEFYARLYLYENATLYETSRDTHLTNYYDMEDFDEVSARFEPPHEDRGVDDDGDELYDRILFSIHVSASATGDYGLEVYVMSPDWYLVDLVWTTVHLEKDVVTEVEFEIDARTVWKSGVDGIWHLNMNLYDDDGYHYYDYDEHNSAHYAVEDFDPPPLIFVPPHTDHGWDVDGNDLYDYLVVDVNVVCSEPGEYTVHGMLYSPFGWEVAHESVTQELDEGDASVRLLFPGWLVRQCGCIGYYDVELWVEDGEGDLMDQDWHETGYYNSFEFETSPVTFVPPHADRAVDGDDDGLYDHIVVSAGVDVRIAHDVVVVGMMFGTGSEPLGSAVTQAHLAEGYHEVELWFDGWTVGASQALPDYVELYVYDTSENLMDTGEHYLDLLYWWDEFDATRPAILSRWAAEAPVMDGVASPSEWDRAVAVDLMAADPVNQLPATMYLMNNGTHLFVLMDVTGDLTQSNDDAVSVSFDTGNDRVLSDGREDQFVVRATEEGIEVAHYVYDEAWGDWAVHCEFDQTLDGHDGLVGAAGFGASPLSSLSHRVFELAIPLALLGLSPGDAVGFAALSFEFPGVQDGETSEYSTWPIYVFGPPGPELYGDLVLSSEPPVTEASVSGTEGLAGWYVSAVEVELTATGGSGGVAATYYRVNGSIWYEYSDPIAVSANGQYTLDYHSVDVAGNQEATRSVTFKVDSQAPATTPALEGDEGDGGWFAGPVEVALPASDAASGLDRTMYRVDGGPWEEYASAFTVSDDGEHTVEYYSVDVAGNQEATGSVAVRIDAAAPETSCELSGTAGGDGWFRSDVTVTFDAEDGTSGVAQTMYSLNGGDWTAVVGPSVTVSVPGESTLEYRSADVAGNQEATRSVTVKIDKTAPATGVAVEGSVVTLSASDDFSGVAQTLYRIDDGDWTVYTEPFEVTGKGSHTVEYRSVDVAGNQEEVRTLEVEASSGAGAFNLELWMVLLITVIIILIALGAMFGMRKKAKDSDTKSIIKDIGSPMAQLRDDAYEPKPSKNLLHPEEEPPPPPDQEE